MSNLFGPDEHPPRGVFDLSMASGAARRPAVPAGAPDAMNALLQVVGRVMDLNERLISIIVQTRGPVPKAPDGAPTPGWLAGPSQEDVLSTARGAAPVEAVAPSQPIVPPAPRLGHREAMTIDQDANRLNILRGLHDAIQTIEGDDIPVEAVAHQLPRFSSGRSFTDMGGPKEWARTLRHMLLGPFGIHVKLVTFKSGRAWAFKRSEIEEAFKDYGK